MGQLCQGFGTGKGQECAGMALWRQHVLLLSGEPWRMLQLLMHRVISQAGGIAVLTVSKVISVVLGAVPAQVGVRSVLHLSLLSCRIQSPEEGAAASGLGASQCYFVSRLCPPLCPYPASFTSVSCPH